VTQAYSELTMTVHGDID